MTTAPVPAAGHPPTGAPAAGAHLRRLRWAVRATLTLGVAASVAANILHARPNPISQMIAAWPPLALLLTVELISRVPTHRRSLAVIRLTATVAIAGIAAWVSYVHMVGVAVRYGETEAAASYLLPLSVDGLVVVASISLVEISGRIRADDRRTSAQSAATARWASPASAIPVAMQDAFHVRPGMAPASTTATVGPTAAPPPEPQQPGPEPVPASADRSLDAPVGSPAASACQPSTAGTPTVTTAATTAPTSQAAQQLADRSRDHSDHAQPHVSCDPEGGSAVAGQAVTRGEDDGEVPSDTAAAVAYWHRRDPTLHPAEVAARIGRSERTVRRYWPPATMTGGRAVNGLTVRR